MKIKLSQGIAGTRFAFQPRHVIQCSDATGKRLIDAGVGVEVSNDAEVDGELHDATAEERLAGEQKQAAIKSARGPRETAAKAAPEAAVTQGAPAKCTGQTKQGNPCLKAPLPGTDRCAGHPREK